VPSVLSARSNSNSLIIAKLIKPTSDPGWTKISMKFLILFLNVVKMSRLCCSLGAFPEIDPEESTTKNTSNGFSRRLQPPTLRCMQTGVGLLDGANVGNTVGVPEGCPVGITVGVTLGSAVGIQPIGPAQPISTFGISILSAGFMND